MSPAEILHVPCMMPAGVLYVPCRIPAEALDVPCRIPAGVLHAGVLIPTVICVPQRDAERCIQCTTPLIVTKYCGVL